MRTVESAWPRALAERVGAQFALVLVSAPSEERRARLRAREQDPEAVSDASWDIAEQIAAEFEPPTELRGPELLLEPSGGREADAIVAELLRRLGAGASGDAVAGPSEARLAG